ncbi:MAG: heparinase II/III family protein, partial [Planctomycetes bacterium]|nr:heparinase II/III family protein [Planctomycetota bacterium]
GEDFGREGILYERQGDRGYVSTWHDACEETRLLALAYDAIFEAAREDRKLVEFLRQKAEEFDVPNPKSNFEQIQDNIESRILRDVLQNRHKINTNFPGAETCCAVIRSVLEWPEKRDDILREMDPVIEEATCTDGVTGEKGLPAYGSYVIRKLATWLQRYERIEPGFIREMLERHPPLRDTWRFHIDTWCLQKYYPTCGDASAFARPSPQYLGVNLSRPDLQPDHGYSARALGVSAFTFLWRLYETTGDPAYAKIMWLANGQTTENLPWDVYAEDVADIPEDIDALIRREGSRIYPGSIDMKQWHIALLRAGQGSREHVAWIDYDSAGNHGHQDAMNVGLYAFGLDLMPDFGYPPVQFGGWNSERANWYRQTAAHNTVVVDGKDQIGARQRAEGRGGIGGETTLRADGRWIRAVRIEAANQYEQTSRYERTLAMVEINEDAFCLLDIFRVAGGQDHALFRHSHFARIQTDGLGLEPAEDYGHDTIMRGFQTDPNPDPGWSVTWNVEDRYGLSNTSEKVVLRHIGLTTDAQVSLCEGWIIEGGYDKNEEAWIPRLMVRRRAAEPSLSSTFVSVVEVHEGKPAMSQVHRLAVRGADGCEMGDSSVAVEVKLRDGRRDLLVFPDAQEKTEAKVTWNSTDITLEGEACWLRRSGAGAVTHAALMRGRELHAGKFKLIAAHDSDLTELTAGT